MSDEETECSPSGDKSVVVDAKHYLAKYAFKGGAILQAIRGRFRSPFSVDIVFGKVRDPRIFHYLCFIFFFSFSDQSRSLI